MRASHADFDSLRPIVKRLAKGIGLGACALLAGCQLLSGLADLETGDVDAGADGATADAASGTDGASTDGTVGTDANGDATLVDVVSDGPLADADEAGDAAAADANDAADASAIDANDATVVVDAADAADASDANDANDAAVVDAGTVTLTLNVLVRPGATLTSISVNGTAVCSGGACAGTITTPVPKLATITVHASPGAENDAHFGGALCKGTADCQFVADADKSASLTVTAQNYVFATSTKHDGNFAALAPAPTGGVGDGLAGADALCKSLATQAGLPGTYVAWLSTPEVSAIERIQTARGWINTHGDPVFDNPIGTLGDPGINTGEMFYAVGYDESGAKVTPLSYEFVFTGTQGNGTRAPDNFHSNGHCNRWTSNNGPAANYGFAFHGSQNWSDYDIRVIDKSFNEQWSCSQQGRVYCFGISHATATAKPVIPTRPAVSRRVFLSQTVTAAMSTAAFDTACGSEASAMSLGGAWSAYLSTTTQSATDRVPLLADTSRGGFYRLDGVPVFPSVGDLVRPNAAPRAAITQLADGSYLLNDRGYAWTGVFGPANAPTPAAPGAPGPTSYTCADWTVATGSNGATGTASAVLPELLNGEGIIGLNYYSCDVPARFYCFER